MKKLILSMALVMLLCGCSTAGNKDDNGTLNLTEKIENACSADRDYADVPRIKESSFADMDIATYKINWNGKNNDDARMINNSVERFVPTDVGAGRSFEFTFSENEPDNVIAVEWIINNTEIPLKDDPDAVCTDIEGVLYENKFTFDICAENKSGLRIEKRLIVLNCKWNGGEEAEYAFLLDVTDAAVVEEHMYEAKDITAFPGITMTLEGDGINKTYAIADIKNDTDKYITVGSWYRLDVLKDDVWYKMNYKASVPGVSWTDEGYGVAEGYSTRLVTDWSSLYGELEAGDYRLVKTFFFEGNPTEYELCAEFAVPLLVVN